MRKNFVNEVCRLLGAQRKDLIEKDLILHQLLLDLSNDGFFRENFVFKGGTCIIKNYLGYFRFSEDIDFTWRNQEVFKRRSQKEIRGYLSKIIDKLGELFEKRASVRGFDFRCDKRNRKYVELGGGNKTLTFKIWFRSDITGGESFVKVQVNFVERLIFKPRKAKLNSLLQKKKLEELEALFPELYKEYSSTVPFTVYDIREIVCEKVRSILTRRGTKARDFIDIFMVWEKLGVGAYELEDQIIEKIRFMLNLYARFKRNFSDNVARLASGEIFSWGEEKELLLTEINERKLYRFIGEFAEFLKRLAEKIKF